MKESESNFNLDLRMELPQGRVPVTLIIDDGVPLFCGDLIRWTQQPIPDLPEHRLCRAQGDGEKRYEQSLFFLEKFAATIEACRIKGKLSIVPYIPDLGFINRIYTGAKKRYLDRFLDIIRKDVSKSFDFTPEVITHDDVYDIKNDRFIPEKEWVWGQSQPLDVLVEYFSRSLGLLSDVGINCTGMTSPCDFGSKNEANYVHALRHAMQDSMQTSQSWYFLHNYAEGYPRLMYFDRTRPETVTSVGTINLSDIGMRRKSGDDILKNIDCYTNNFNSGFMDRAIAAKSPAVFCMHWWLINSSGALTGLKILEGICRRLAEKYPEQILWMTGSELAFYYAAINTAWLEQSFGNGKIKIAVNSPVKCGNFTFSAHCPMPVKSIARLDSGNKTQMLLPVADRRTLAPGTWHAKDGRLTICLPVDLKNSMEIALA